MQEDATPVVEPGLGRLPLGFVLPLDLGLRLDGAPQRVRIERHPPERAANTKPDLERDEGHEPRNECNEQVLSMCGDVHHGASRQGLARAAFVAAETARTSSDWSEKSSTRATRKPAASTIPFTAAMVLDGGKAARCGEGARTYA